MPDPTFTPIGSVRFEQARARLAAREGREVEDIPDADVEAFLATGPTPAPPQREVP